MNQKQIAIIKQQLTVKDGQPVTTSRQVAEAFKKEHKHVIRDIEQLDCSPEFNRSNFGPISYRDNYNREQKAYALTKDGFMRLTFGYRDRNGNHMAELYIAAFNLMEQELRSGMARTREELTDRLMMVVADAARQGYDASFIPQLVRYRRLGLTQTEIGRLFGMPKSTVCGWVKKISAAGVELPQQSKGTTTIFFKKLHEKREKQLPLPFAGGQ